jgi:anti-sigma regulatory factor (Ser/Thr protein kinase)
MTAELGRCFPSEVLDAAALVVSELVGNAVRHGAALPGGGLLASWHVLDRGLRVQVVDGGAGPVGPVGHAAPDAEGGRGLELVDALALCWGSTSAAAGTAVWAELPRSILLPD